MKKYQIIIFGIIFTLFGVILSTTFSASAASILIGKKIDSTIAVIFNGKKLSNDAIVVDGTSYLPVRTISNEIGLNIKIKNNVIDLSSKGVVSVSNTQSPADQQSLMEDYAGVQNNISKINGYIGATRRKISDLKEWIKPDEEKLIKARERYNNDSILKQEYPTFEESPNYISLKKTIDENNLTISNFEIEITNYENQLPPLQSKLNELYKTLLDMGIEMKK